MVTTFIVGFAYQSSKVCMDSVVQADSDDAFVGRVFALYDTANNLCYVGAFALGVLLVPANGKGVGAVFLIGALFLVAGVGYGMAMARLTRRHAAAGQTLTPSEQIDAAGGHPIVEVQADPVARRRGPQLAGSGRRRGRRTAG